jgi:hypothetical protein
MTISDAVAGGTHYRRSIVIYEPKSDTLRLTTWLVAA